MTLRAVTLVAALGASPLLGCASSARPAAVTPSASTPTDARVPSADGVSIHYVVQGSGPAVVLLHCLGCDLHYWDVAADALARDHRVVRIDLAGHGGSGDARKTWSLDGFVADVSAVVDAAGLERFTLVGHSMSGPIAIETALRLGDRVTGVVPVDTLLDADERIPDEQRQAMLAQVRGDYRGFVEALFPHLMPKNPDPQVVARVKADALKKDPERTAAILAWLLAYPAGTTMDRLGMPIVAIDSDLRPVALERNRAHAPQFDARILGGTGHFLMLDKPAEFASTLPDVVESVESGKARRRGTRSHTG